MIWITEIPVSSVAFFKRTKKEAVFVVQRTVGFGNYMGVGTLQLHIQFSF